MFFRLKMIIVAAPLPPPRSATVRPRSSHQRAAAALAVFTAAENSSWAPAHVQPAGDPDRAEHREQCHEAVPQGHAKAARVNAEQAVEAALEERIKAPMRLGRRLEQA